MGTGTEGWLVTFYTESGSREPCYTWLSFSLFQISAHEMVQSAIVRLSALVSLIQTLLQRHTQKLASTGILEPVGLTADINHRFFTRNWPSPQLPFRLMSSPCHTGEQT